MTDCHTGPADTHSAANQPQLNNVNNKKMSGGDDDTFPISNGLSSSEDHRTDKSYFNDKCPSDGHEKKLLLSNQSHSAKSPTHYRTQMESGTTRVQIKPEKSERPIVHVELRKVSSVVIAGNFLRDSVCCFYGNAIAMYAVFVFLSSIPVSMIGVGSLYIHSCPIEPLIPIYLVVGGTLSLFHAITANLCRYRARKVQTAETTGKHYSTSLNGILGLFHLAWFIAGSIWVFRVFKPEFVDETIPADYCHPLPFWFAFCVISSQYVVIGAVIIVVFFILCVGLFCRSVK